MAHRGKYSSRRLSPLVRDLVRVRDANCCVDCGGTKKLEIHHIRPVSLGGGNEPENLVLLCHACHAMADLQALTCGRSYHAALTC